MGENNRTLKLVLVHCLMGRNSSPHVGLLSLAAYVKKNLEWVNVKVIEDLDPTEKILKMKADVIGFTADTIAFNKTLKVARIIKDKGKCMAKIIIGGVHISACPEVIGEPFDVGVWGEGEVTLEILLKLFRKKKNITTDDLKKIDGLVFVDKGRIVKTKKREFIKNIDTLPFPARELVPMEEDYFKRQVNLYGIRKMVTVMTSRGCPYHCVYCGSPVQWGNVRFHSAEYVIEEIRQVIKKYKADGIMFSDDLFIVPRERLLKLVELIKNEGWEKKIVFSGFARANLMDEEICRALKSINVHKLTFGFESYSETMLEYLKDRSVTVEQNIQAIKLCHKYGIAAASGLIVGTPGETLNDLNETYRIMKEQPMDNTQIYILTPYPGTKIWNYAEKEGLVNLEMDMDKLFVQVPLSASWRWWKKDKFFFLKDRIFLNQKMRNNQKYLGMILKMNQLAFWQNIKYYLKQIIKSPKVLLRVGKLILSDD